MAFCLGIPLYIICQNNLVEEGLIESKNDWWVQYAEISPAAFSRTEVTQSIRAWIKDEFCPTVESRACFA